MLAQSAARSVCPRTRCGGDTSLSPIKRFDQSLPLAVLSHSVCPAGARYIGRHAVDQPAGERDARVTCPRTPDSRVTRAQFGVIGGSGFYDLFTEEDRRRVEIETPYGSTSDTLTLGMVAGRSVAFVPRHGAGHTIPPHRINYRANLWALASLGVERVVAPCAVGSLRRELGRGHVVVCDQLIDATKGRRDDTFFDGPDVAHLSAATPYCAAMREAAVQAGQDARLTVHDGGTVVVIDGPRFATIAESRVHSRNGADVINMTQYPEVVLARELGMCYAALGLVTDYDSGLDQDGATPVTQEEVLRVFADCIPLLRQAVLRLIETLPAQRTCACGGGRPRSISH